MIDKSKELEANLILINDNVKFSGEAAGNPSINIDYVPPIGGGDGYTSLELLLLSLSSCLGTAVLIMLRRENISITSFAIKSKGSRRQEHPTGFETIDLEISIKSENLTPAIMDKVINISESICQIK